MLTFDEALKIALNNDYTEKELNYCMELEEYFYFCEKRKDGKRFLGGPACFIMKEDGKKYYNPLVMNTELSRNTTEDKILKEGYLSDFRKAN